MRELLLQLWHFVGAVWQHWIWLVGGCALIVIVGLAERASGSPVPWRLFAELLAALVLWACFLSWRDEHKKSCPGVQLYLGGMEKGDLQEKQAIGIFMGATLVNRGSPTALSDWRLLIKVPGFRRHLLGSHAVATNSINLEGHPMPLNQQLSPKYICDPMPNGKREQGFIMLLVEGVAHAALMRDGIRYEVQCFDVWGNCISASKKWNGIGQRITPPDPTPPL